MNLRYISATAIALQMIIILDIHIIELVIVVKVWPLVVKQLATVEVDRSLKGTKDHGTKWRKKSST